MVMKESGDVNRAIKLLKQAYDLQIAIYKREVWLECVMECPSTQAINTAQYIDDLTAQQLHDVLGVLAQVVKIELTVLPTERYRNVYCKMTRPNSLLFS
jgi:hypothetical protein